MIPAKQAHEMTAKRRESREFAQLQGDLANIEREVMKAIERGEFFADVDPETFAAPREAVDKALVALGYTLQPRTRKKKTWTVSWGAPKAVRT